MASTVACLSLLAGVLLTLKFSLATNDRPPSFTADGQPSASVVVELGSNLVLPCGVTGTPNPDVTWFREGMEIDPANVTDGGTLNITVTESVASPEGINYYCVANNTLRRLTNNTLGPGNFPAALRSRDVNVSHFFFDGFRNTTVRDVEVATVVGGQVALECDFGASNPPPQVTWFADDVMVQEIVTNNAMLFLSGGRYLFIRELSMPQRMMQYHCSVSNSLYPNPMPMRAPTTYTLSGDLPRDNSVNVFLELGSMVGAVGDTLVFTYAAAARNTDGDAITLALTCSASANPLVTLLSSPVLPIVTVTLINEASNEQVEFTCQLGSVITGVIQDITGTIIVSRPGSPPSIVDPLANLIDRISVDDGPVEYSCVATGSPNITITWFYNGEDIPSDNGVDVSGDTLIIPTPQTNHSGIYQCFATNQFGDDSRAWTVEVGEPDDDPCPNQGACTTPPPTPMTTPGNSTPKPFPITGLVIGLVVGGAVIILVVAMIIIIVCVVKSKKMKSSPDPEPSKKESLYTEQPLPLLAPPVDPGPEKADEADFGGPAGATYADPRSIEHEAVGGTGDEYALVATKKKGKADQVEAPGIGADMYSVPDKSKKQKNQPLVYADVDVVNPRRKPPPTSQELNGFQEPVTYSEVAHAAL